MFNELKKFKVQKVLALEKNDSQIFYSCTKLIGSNLDIDEAFKPMHQSIMTKTKIYICKDYIDLDAIIKHSINIFEC